MTIELGDQIRGLPFNIYYASMIYHRDNLSNALLRILSFPLLYFDTLTSLIRFSPLYKFLNVTLNSFTHSSFDVRILTQSRIVSSLLLFLNASFKNIFSCGAGDGVTGGVKLPTQTFGHLMFSAID